VRARATASGSGRSCRFVCLFDPTAFPRYRSHSWPDGTSRVFHVCACWWPAASLACDTELNVANTNGMRYNWSQRDRSPSGRGQGSAVCKTQVADRVNVPLSAWSSGNGRFPLGGPIPDDNIVI
jgi:hypothetical protein